ncbi:MAG: sulfotransferase [Elainellaceae cyanobacterium]
MNFTDALSQSRTVETASVLEAPLFLIGAERSGTTLLRLMLDGHPKVTWCHEFEYAVDQVSDTGDWPDLDAYHAWLEVHRIFLANEFTVDKTLNYRDLLNSFLLQKRDRHGKPTVGATVHRHFNRLLTLWPNAKLIYILRDGRDVARSNIGMGWAGNVWAGVERWLDVEQEWQSIRSTLPEEQWIELRYEDLITHPEQQLSRLCEFMGLDYDPGMMSYIETTPYSYPDPKRIQQWRKKLSEPQIRLVEARAAEILAYRGYDLSGFPPLTVMPYLKRYLRLQSWIYCVTFRMRRHGLGLFAADFIARKLGLSAWQRRLKHIINEQEKAHIALFDGAGTSEKKRLG